MAKAIIAVSGKGGVGKTSIAAAMLRTLCESYPAAKILAVDADPAVGLSTALGVEIRETLDDIRKTIVKQVDEGQTRQAIELLNEARYHILDTLVEGRGFTFLAIGRPETAGCYCSINSYLKEVMTLLASDFDYVVIDGEAGIEQINRRVMEKVSHLILVSDQSRKGLQVVETIRRVADELVMYQKIGVVLNRVTNPELLPHSLPNGLKLLADIPMDNSYAENEILGKSVFELPSDSMVLEGVRTALKTIGLLGEDENNGG